MKTITYHITLKSDGEPGSGTGGEIVNDIVARDHQGNPVIRASHIKGLVRDRLKAICAAREWPRQLDDDCLGKEGDDAESLVCFKDATGPKPEQVRQIVRTAVGKLGVVSGGTLRTTEAVAAGSKFTATLRIHDEAPDFVDLAMRLALLSLDAVGGGRTRGSGMCVVEIEAETRAPGALLRELDAMISAGVPSVERRSIVIPGDAVDLGAGTTTLRLRFVAEGPICCPDLPVVSNNVIRSGLGVPASAVFGAVISRLAEEDPALAQAAFEDRRTRAWPLLPLSLATDPTNSSTVPVRVSLSHRMSKLPKEGAENAYDFEDPAIEAYEWEKAAHGSPLKASDGVLLWSGDPETIHLWRSADMPRVLSSHSVHHGEKRNLFTVESLAPMTLSGWITLPARAAETLTRMLEKDRMVTFGKARSVRGSGSLWADTDDFSQAFAGWEPKVFVLQSPLAIPDHEAMEHQRADSLLRKLVHAGGWGEVEDRDTEEGLTQVDALAGCGIRFGWNRHGLGQQVKDTRRLRARRVLLPGTVFVLKTAPANLADLLVRGLGLELDGDIDGRTQGFGAVLPHPGRARQRFEPLPPIAEVEKSGPAGKCAIQWHQRTHHNSPSPSQIAAVAQRVGSKDNGKDRGAVYLQHQKDDRPARVWERWAPVFEDVMKAIDQNPEQARQALRTWQDLAILHRDPNSKK